MTQAGQTKAFLERVAQEHGSDFAVIVATGATLTSFTQGMLATLQDPNPQAVAEARGALSTLAATMMTTMQRLAGMMTLDCTQQLVAAINEMQRLADAELDGAAQVAADTIARAMGQPGPSTH